MLDSPASVDAVRPLLRAFRAQRPIRAGSLLMTIFGDSIAPRGGEIALASLIELARPFGLPERLVRTSIGRLAKEDWLEAARVGRNSFYRLTAHGRRELDVATHRIYGAAATEWAGGWTLLLISQLDAADRESLSQAFRWRGFGQPMPGVLAYPADRTEEVERELAKWPAGARALCMRAASGSLAADRLLAGQGWDLADLERRYRRFVRLFQPTLEAVEGGQIAPVASFVIRTLLIHEYRRIHLRDPLLPADLLAPSWPGATAAALCGALYERVCGGAERFVTMHATNRSGALPPPGPEALRRFGGSRRGAAAKSRGAK